LFFCKDHWLEAVEAFFLYTAAQIVRSVSSPRASASLAFSNAWMAAFLSFPLVESGGKG